MLDHVMTASVVTAAACAGLALGAAGQCVVQVAPLAFKRLDYQRADSLVRRMMKRSLPWIGWASAAGAVFAALGAAFAAAGMLALASAGLFLARYALNPLPKRPRTPGARRRHSRTRIVALRVTLVIMGLFPPALAALAVGV